MSRTITLVPLLLLSILSITFPNTAVAQPIGADNLETLPPRDIGIPDTQPLIHSSDSRTGADLLERGEKVQLASRADGGQEDKPQGSNWSKFLGRFRRSKKVAQHGQCSPAAGGPWNRRGLTDFVEGLKTQREDTDDEMKKKELTILIAECEMVLGRHNGKSTEVLLPSHDK